MARLWTIERRRVLIFLVDGGRPGWCDSLVDGLARREFAALEQLTPIVYQELSEAVTGFAADCADSRSVSCGWDQNLPEFQCRVHFFRVASQVMRQVLIDFARKRKTRLTMDDAHAISGEQAEEFLAIHEALDKLKLQDARKAEVIEMKYFGGLSRDEIAEAMGLTVPTVKRDLLMGRHFCGGSCRRRRGSTVE